MLFLKQTLTKLKILNLLKDNLLKKSFKKEFKHNTKVLDFPKTK